MIGIKLAGDAMKRIQRAAKVAEGAIKGAVRKAATRVVRQAKINVKQTLNTTGQSKGFLGRSITMAEAPGRGVRDFAMAVGPTAIYGRIHEFGGVIKPVRAKNLAIPVGSFKGPAKEYPGKLHLVVSRNQGLFLADASGIQYVLKKSVTIPKRPYLQPALDDTAAEIEKDFAAVAAYVLNDEAAAGGGGG